MKEDKREGSLVKEGEKRNTEGGKGQNNNRDI